MILLHYFRLRRYQSMKIFRKLINFGWLSHIFCLLGWKRTMKCGLLGLIHVILLLLLEILCQLLNVLINEVRLFFILPLLVSHGWGLMERIPSSFAMKWVYSNSFYGVSLFLLLDRSSLLIRQIIRFQLWQRLVIFILLIFERGIWNRLSVRLREHQTLGLKVLVGEKILLRLFSLCGFRGIYSWNF